MTTPDPVKTAAAIWEQLVAHQPATAAALAIRLRALPDDWPQREFNSARAYAVLDLPPTYEPADAHALPEIAPYAPDSTDQCQACFADDVDLCRFHTGEAQAHGWWIRRTGEAVKAEPEMSLREWLRRSADASEAEDQMQPPEVVDAIWAGEAGR